jgi:hypothetical protein
MSRRLTSRSSDLQRLVDEGYQLRIVGGFLLLEHVPYVTSDRHIAYGTLVAPLTLSGDVTTRPSDHVVTFDGEMPCDSSGTPLERLAINHDHQVLVPPNNGVDSLGHGVEVGHTFSQKPADGYPDFYLKMTTYANLISGHAVMVDPDVTPRTYAPVVDESENSVFCYLDTASSRAGLNVVNNKLAMNRVAIVGLGGTGSYILDLVAKTLVREIHLFDADPLHTHNAFRAPGAPTIEQLREAPSKVDYFTQMYSPMRRGLVPHRMMLDATNVHELADMDFVFIAVDDANAKGPLFDALEEHGVAFIDVGMGIYLEDGHLSGNVRVTTSTPENRESVRTHVAVVGNPDAVYDHNIQIADLNMLNAVLAVIRWKKLAGFYLDLDREHHSIYVIDGNAVINEDRA